MTAKAYNTALPGQELIRPGDEAAFVTAVTQYSSAYDQGANDLAKGAERPARAQALCKLVDSTPVKDWLGSVDTLSSSNDGHGVLKIRLTEHLTLGTSNNGFSDPVGMRTLLDPGSLVFQAATALHVGQLVRFSGTFSYTFDSKNMDCFEEMSLTQEGAMQDPEFLFRFDSIEGL